jgi:hypothetical protein
MVEYEGNAVGLDTLARTAVHNKLLDLKEIYYGSTMDSIPDWNDDKTRTKSQVIALLDKLIKEVP